MEKLRQRYRAEIQRMANTPRGHRYPSSRVHFKRRDSMELWSSSSDPSVDPNNQDEEDEDRLDDENQDDLMLYPKGIKKAIVLPLNQRYHCNGVAGISAGNGNRNGNGVRIKIPNIATVPPPLSGLNLCNGNRSFDDCPPPVNPYYGSGKGLRDGYTKKAFETGKDRSLGGGGGGGGGRRRREDMESNHSNPVDEMVAAIQMLGDGFVMVERMKMDMARELESMRMKMEMKRTEMILESQ